MSGARRALVVFDLDGTLIDSRQDLADAANALIVERGQQALAADAIGRMVGEGAAVLVRRALDAAGLPMDDTCVPRFLQLYDERLLVNTRPYDGIPDAVARLSEAASVAVLTNKPAAPAVRLLEAFGLMPYLVDVLGGDGPLPRKPDPAALRQLMSKHAAAPQATVLVGDSRIDFETAHNAGTGICLVRFGFGFETFAHRSLRGDEVLVDHPRDLPGALSRWVG